MLSNRQASVIIVAITLVALAPLWGGRFYATGDMRDVYIPLESFFHQQELKGNLPAWLADAAFGFPVIASAQIGFFYPPLLLLRLLPLPWYLSGLLLVHLIWLALGTYLFTREIKLSSSAALLAAISFTWGGFTTLHLTHLNIILALSWLPWQFLAVARLATASFSLRRVMLLALLFGLPFLAGQLQVPALMAMVSVSWFIFLRYRRRQKTGWYVILIAIGAIFLAAAQLLPSLELMLQSTRSKASTFNIVRANQHSYPLYHLPTLLFPRFYGNDDTYWGKRLQIEYGFYVGTISLLLAGVGIRAAWRKRLKRKAGWLARDRFFSLMLVISWLLALGSLSPFRLFGFEPTLWVFSAPARWLLFSSFALSILAALGMDEITKRPADYRRVITSAWCWLLFVVLAANLVLFYGDGLLLATAKDTLTPTHFEKIRSMLSSAKASSVSLLSPYTYLPIVSLGVLATAAGIKRKAKVVLPLVSAELIILFLTTTPTAAWRDILRPPLTVESLPDSVKTRQARLYSVRDSGGDRGAYFTDPRSRANKQKREQQRQLLIPLTHTVFGLAGVEWPASLDLSNQSIMLESLKKDNSYEIADPALATEMNIGAVLRVAADSVKVDKVNFEPRIQLTQGETSKAIVYPDSGNPSRLTFNVTAKKAASVIVRDTIYPGWRAYVDGVRVKIYDYLLIFRRIFIPAGEHTVTFVYEPTWLYIGMIMTALFLVVFVGVNI